MKLFLTTIILLLWANAPSAVIRKEVFLQEKPKYIGINVTCYYPVSGQTDSTPRQTACMDNIPYKGYGKLRWCAVSRDLFKKFPCGSQIEIENAGKYSGTWTVKDKTNKRFKNRVDLLIEGNDKFSFKCTLKTF